jgi:hypothetical protein
LSASNASPSGGSAFTRYALLAAAGLAVVALIYSSQAPREMADLRVYWTAAGRAADAEPLYRAADGHYQFKYLPAFAILTMPLGLLPWGAAKIAWFTLSAALLAALVPLGVRLPVAWRRPGWVLVTITVVAMAKFYGHELVLGQVNVLFAVLVVLALHAMKSGREAAAGVLVALAIVVKPYAVIFLPWLAARRQTASLATALVGFVVAIALPIPLYGVEGTVGLHTAWWRTVTESTAPNLTNADNVSLAAMYAKWLGAGPAAAALAAASSLAVLAAAAVVFVLRRGVRFPEGLEGALLLTCIPLISPQGWDYVFLVSTPAIVYLANHDDQLPGALRWLTIAAVATIGLSLFDVLGRQGYARFMALSIITLCYLVVVAALCALRMRRAA